MWWRKYYRGSDWDGGSTHAVVTVRGGGSTHAVVTGMAELPAALDAGEATLVVVNEHVVVEAVLTRERRVADETHVRLDTCQDNA